VPPAGAVGADTTGGAAAISAADQFAAVAANAADAGSNAPRGFAPCVNGFAAGTYACDGVDMLSHLTLSDLDSVFVNDMWGWTDPLTGRDYALLGMSEGMTVIDITDPKRPDIIGRLPTHTTAGGDFWRDIKVYRNHAYVVSENTNHGMQVFDLAQVRGITGDPVTFAATNRYTGFGNAHNLFINEDTGYAYAVGTGTCGSGLHMVNLADPANPASAGCFGNQGYIHDTQCVIYGGPDTEHRGKEICFNSVPAGADSMSIVDVTDKNNPVSLAQLQYPTFGYSHQGWLTPDESYFLHNDELDEPVNNIPTTTRIFDVRDLDAPVLVAAVAHETTSIGHNAYTEGRYAFASNYTSGLRVFDITGVSGGAMPQAVFFDTYPLNDNPSFEGGTWSNYAFFKQKKVVAVSSIDGGLFVLQPRIGS
jgi:choice-of-anchor B domain-containing protein